MRRKFALLALAVGALLALAGPASSIAYMVPPSAKFEIPAEPNGPKLVTSLGSCSVKITGTIPSGGAPERSSFEVPAPVVGGCTSGTSVTVSGKWNLSTSYPQVLLTSASGSVVFRFSSLPGCKLVGGSELSGFWSDGVISTTMKSYYHAGSTSAYAWQSDGGSCALSGTETVHYESTAFGSGGYNGVGGAVNNLTTPGGQVLVY